MFACQVPTDAFADGFCSWPQIENALLLAAADKSRAERDADAARRDADSARRDAEAGRQERDQQAGLIDELKDKLSTVGR
jgi:hypothetical protein